MPTDRPVLVLRLGSHSEKEYIEKIASRLDAVIIGANLMEATPGATASLAVKLSGARTGIDVYIDPMTYVFGTYVDRDGIRHADLDWIKSDQKVRGQPGKVVHDFKRSYRALAERLGGLVQAAVDRSQAITPEDLAKRAAARKLAGDVILYQNERIAEEFKKDPDFADVAGDVPRPRHVLAPYFYVDPTNWREWSKTNQLLAEESVRVSSTPVHAVVAADVEFLSNERFLAATVDALRSSGVKGVWFWFSRFAEDTAEEGTLVAWRKLVEGLAPTLDVFTMHGGFFSMALSKHGLRGVSHGVGYGEQKDILPVIGQSTPMVRYYVPPLRRKKGVPDVQLALDALGVASPGQFFEQVCDCVICKGIIGGDLDQFALFGDMHRSTPSSKRLAQTPAAAKRCRFHFMLRRLQERSWIEKATLGEIADRLASDAKRWSTLDTAHLARWRRVLIA